MELLKQQEKETVLCFKTEVTKSKKPQKRVNKKPVDSTTSAKRKVNLQLKKRDPFYNQFIIFDSSKSLSIEENNKLKKLLGRELQMWEGDFRRLIYKFPNGSGISVVMSIYTAGYWEVTDMNFSTKPIKKSLPKKKRLRKKLMAKYNSDPVTTSNINRYLLFSDVEEHMAKVYAYHK
ncbi:hypothetical protein WKH56_08840 [Priestia sp. SB1]|uniref:hypothetical protein n=1 Tax=Priestia sp. SB1 TaxID=3132359 RepID=UPI003171780E